MSDLNKLKELVETLKPNYGGAGSRDVDVTAKRKAADEIIDQLEAAEQPIAEMKSSLVSASKMQTVHREACQKAEAELARRNAAAGKPVLYQKLSGHDSSWSECSKDWYDDSRAYHRDFNEGAHLAPVRALFTAAQPAVLPWHADSCSNCGSKLLSWDTTVVKNTAVQDGLLKLNETSGLFYLGCDECSETLLRVSADEVASYLNNAKTLGCKAIKLPKVNHPAQFDYADRLTEALKVQGFTVEG